MTRLPYATAMPSGVLGPFPVVAFDTFSVRFSAACATALLTTSAIFQTWSLKLATESLATYVN